MLIKIKKSFVVVIVVWFNSNMYDIVAPNDKLVEESDDEQQDDKQQQQQLDMVQEARLWELDMVQAVDMDMDKDMVPVPGMVDLLVLVLDKAVVLVHEQVLELDMVVVLWLQPGMVVVLVLWLQLDMAVVLVQVLDIAEPALVLVHLHIVA